MTTSHFEPVDLSRISKVQRALISAHLDATAPELWLEIAEHNFVLLRCTASLAAQSDETLVAVSFNLMQQFVANFGGMAVYIPNGTKFYQSTKATQIVQEFDGTNIRHLARKHHVSDIRVRQIIQEDADLKKAARTVATP